MIAGTKALIEKGRVYRKMFGGGMRQAGVTAAAGLIALEKSPAVLHIDQENAKRLGEGIAEIPRLTIDSKKACSNIVIFDCTRTGKTAEEVCVPLPDHGAGGEDTGRILMRIYAHLSMKRAE